MQLARWAYFRIMAAFDLCQVRLVENTVLSVPCLTNSPDYYVVPHLQSMIHIEETNKESSLAKYIVKKKIIETVSLR